MFIIWKERQGQGSSAGRWTKIKEHTLHKASGVLIPFYLSLPAPMTCGELHVTGAA
ncbi:hypothetical protein BD311DRAFT_769278 [Dichomitus squalens]|uniref:Uncharacterized protein n=1 Tax=Dichomitus squalens TaxID=114155 RepID=A0A4Q9PZP3_9APHY|nr:hypothetical protein BD311DRAFT_769278 [Dichomitus squalens]TBU55994.1 hypothetical protein BD310DRAFT_932371 [Dichomitus squalens]TBU60090.1 hypothetical protein BD310DRAFT_923314 [Dichomitus squalens]